MTSILAVALLAQLPAEVRVTSEFVANGPGREILSPALPRNATTKFHLTIAAPALTEFKLWIGQNPEGALDIEVLRDGRAMALPYTSVVPPGESALTLEMRIRVPGDAPVRRMKVEPEAWIDERWINYPMEVRIVKATVPGGPPPARSWQEYFCGKGTVLAYPQDLLLSKGWAQSNVREAFERALGRPIAQWCTDGKLPADPEWYLKFSDWLVH